MQQQCEWIVMTKKEMTEQQKTGCPKEMRCVNSIKPTTTGICPKKRPFSRGYTSLQLAVCSPESERQDDQGNHPITPPFFYYESGGLVSNQSGSTPDHRIVNLQICNEFQLLISQVRSYSEVISYSTHRLCHQRDYYFRGT